MATHRNTALAMQRFYESMQRLPTSAITCAEYRAQFSEPTREDPEPDLTRTLRRQEKRFRAGRDLEC